MIMAIQRLLSPTNSLLIGYKYALTTHTMKKLTYLFILFISALANQAFAQAITTEPAEFSPSDSVKFIIDVKLCTNQGLLNHDPEDVYLWTWNPAESTRPSEYAQGAWTASNEALKCKYEGDNVWSYKMKPTAFYGVDAATCYEKDFSMLLKAKDGSAQTEDLKVEIDAPFTGPKKLYSFPDKQKKDSIYAAGTDVITVFFNKSVETKANLLAATEFSVDPAAIYSDGTSTAHIVGLSQIGTSPEVQMKDMGNNLYKFTFIPNRLFASKLPSGAKITQVKMRILIKPSGFPAGDSFVDDALLMTGGYFIINLTE